MGKKREKEEERKRDGACTTEAGALKQRRDSRIRQNPLSNGEMPSLTGESIGTERKNLRLAEESEEADQWQTGQSEKYRQSVPRPYVPWTGTCATGVQTGWELLQGV